MRTQHIKYALPSTKYFGMDFPQTIVLSPGMSYSIEVTFRPILKQAYEDVIECTTDKGKFIVPIKATVPHLDLELSNNGLVEFGMCPVHEITARTFEVKNSGQLDFKYSWISSHPFDIKPTDGTVPMGQSSSFTVTFDPKVSLLESLVFWHFWRKQESGKQIVL